MTGSDRETPEDGPDPPGPADPIGDLFAAWHARVEAGEAVEFEAFAASHPEHADELRKLHEGWRLLLRLFPGPKPGSFAEQIRRHFGEGVHPEISIESDAEVVSEGRDDAGDRVEDSGLLEELKTRGPTSSRYRLHGEVGRGGMGAVFRVYDTDLRRNLAMKVLLEDEQERLSRFLEEAQTTGQLDHPGIVPVHEIGLDGQGRVYFTMKLVKGETLQKIFERVRAGEGEWNSARALGVLLRVCDAMAFAHEKGVIHRDLKPANVMVGRHGEVYVMDWGLARVTGRKESKDVRIDPRALDSVVQTERRRKAGGGGDPSDMGLVTMDGDVLGTPCYMPLEQAEGRLEDIGPHSDVYAVGAMLYDLLAGRPPYTEPGEHATGRVILQRVLVGSPRSIASLAPSAAPELLAISERAMSRRIADRYPSMQALASELRAHLEQRVVAAYESGAVAELKKWVRRNPAFATLAAMLVVALVIGAVAIARKRAELGTRNAELRVARDAADTAATAASRQAEVARANERRAKDERDRTLRLADHRRLRLLVDESPTIWPAYPDRIESMEGWIGRAERLLGDLPLHEEALRDVRSSGTRQGLGGKVDIESDYEFAGDDDRAWWHDAVRDLVVELRTLGSADLHAPTLRSMQARVEFARTIVERSMTGEDPAARWAEARAAVRDHPLYGGLELAPQIGLVPLGKDPGSSLWEFAHLQSGSIARRDPATRRSIVDEGTGLVLVLIPGGTYTIGAQTSDPLAPYYDPSARSYETPTRTVTLAPYFISKYEMTNAQWQRATGRAVSPEWSADPTVVLTPLHPADAMTWNECVAALHTFGLELPRESEWEVACRAGTTTTWWTGADPASLEGAANLADESLRLAGHVSDVMQPWNDGSPKEAPVGSFRPNGFGLHDVCGNVLEWCIDSDTFLFASSAQGETARAPTSGAKRIIRGGAFPQPPSFARSAWRDVWETDSKNVIIGCRPSRPIDASGPTRGSGR